MRKQFKSENESIGLLNFENLRLTVQFRPFKESETSAKNYFFGVDPNAENNSGVESGLNRHFRAFVHRFYVFI